LDTFEDPVLDTFEDPVLDMFEDPVLDTFEDPVLDMFEDPVLDTLEDPSTFCALSLIVRLQVWFIFVGKLQYFVDMLFFIVLHRFRFGHQKFTASTGHQRFPTRQSL
jgi:hypothetical protein